MRPSCRSRSSPPMRCSWKCCRIRFMRLVMTHAGKRGRAMGSTCVGTAFAEDDARPPWPGGAESPISAGPSCQTHRLPRRSRIRRSGLPVIARHPPRQLHVGDSLGWRTIPARPNAAPRSAGVGLCTPRRQALATCPPRRPAIVSSVSFRLSGRVRGSFNRPGPWRWDLSRLCAASLSSMRLSWWPDQAGTVGGRGGRPAAVSARAGT